MSNIKNNVYYAIRELQDRAYRNYLSTRYLLRTPKKQLEFNKGYRQGIDEAIMLLIACVGEETKALTEAEYE